MADVQMMNRYCYFCMNPLQETQHKCPVCKHDRNEKVDAHGHLPRCILNNQYLVGKKLGNGGFGITYIGRDLFLDRIVAIKEYFPNSLAYRGADGMSVAAYNDVEGQNDQFEHGKQRAISEARTVVKMSDLPHVVQMYNAFLANGTAYIVMEYITGETLANCIKREGKPLKWQRAAELLLPLLADLQQMHNKNFIHRDISPDNIMIRKSTNKAVLLDFGAARDFHSEYTVAAGAIRDGYTPIEQYSDELEGQDGRTDEYAFCATMYFALTGEKPMNANHRAFDDQLVAPRKLGSDIDPAREAVLMQGFSVYKEQRYPNVMMLAQALVDPSSVQFTPPPVPQKQEVEPNPLVSVQVPQKKSSRKVLLAVLAAVLIAAAGFAAFVLLPSEAPSAVVFANGLSISSEVGVDPVQLSGEITAENGEITNVVAEIFEGDRPLLVYQVEPNTASYQLKESELHSWLQSVIGTLGDGTYRCCIRAAASNGSTTVNEVLLDEQFKMVAKQSETAAIAVSEAPHSDVITPSPTPDMTTPEPNRQTINMQPVPSVSSKLIRVGDTVHMGMLEQDGDKQNGQEAIEWLVLEIQDDKALLVSKYVLKAKRYRIGQSKKIEWETSEARSWLNSEFAHSFTPEEMQAIFAANQAEDPVFLLTKSEAEQYFADQEQRKVQRTAAVTEWNGMVCPWVLMSQDNLDYVDEKGEFHFYNNSDSVSLMGIRPAVWINLAAAGYDTVKPLNTDVKQGSVVSFGSYMHDADGTRRPAEWIVISREGSIVQLLSKDLLDSRQYHDARMDISWKDCSLRSWLNTEFISTAFTAEEQTALSYAQLADTDDRVYLLSQRELEALYPEAENRISHPTRYAESVVEEAGFWWLRMDGGMDVKAPVVNAEGDVYFGGNYVDVMWDSDQDGQKDVGNGVRPVICVDLNLLNK